MFDLDVHGLTWYPHPFQTLSLTTYEGSNLSQDALHGKGFSLYCVILSFSSFLVLLGYWHVNLHTHSKQASPLLQMIAKAHWAFELFNNSFHWPV